MLELALDQVVSTSILERVNEITRNRHRETIAWATQKTRELQDLCDHPIYIQHEWTCINGEIYKKTGFIRHRKGLTNICLVCGFEEDARVIGTFRKPELVFTVSFWQGDMVGRTQIIGCWRRRILKRSLRSIIHRINFLNSKGRLGR